MLRVEMFVPPLVELGVFHVNAFLFILVTRVHACFVVRTGNDK